MELLYTILVILFIVFLGYLVFELRKNSLKVDKLNLENKRFLESIEKYVEIFNEQNVKDLLLYKKLANPIAASETINTIKEEYRSKLLSKGDVLSEEHEMLIDFISLSLSLLIKTPPNLREKIINENTSNDVIKTILNAKLPNIEKHFVPVSILEVAISEHN